MLPGISSSISTNLVIENITAVWFFTCSLIGNLEFVVENRGQIGRNVADVEFLRHVDDRKQIFQCLESIVTQNDLMPAAAVTSMSMTMSFCTSYCLSIS